MKQVNVFYYKKLDSLQLVKEADTSSAKQHAIAEEIVSTDTKRSALLLKLQKEHDFLEAVLKEY